MKKRNIVLIAVSLAVITAAGVSLYALTRPSTTPSKSLASGMTYADAKHMPLREKCLAKNPTLTISASERSTVELDAMSHLYDVPAGTNVDVLIASYSNDRVTGSEHYPPKYGNYNFTMNRQPNGDWQFAKFERCS